VASGLFVRLERRSCCLVRNRARCGHGYLFDDERGKTWVEHRSPAANPALLALVSPSTWFAAIDRTLYRTTDGSTSWSTVRGSLNVGGVQASNTLDFVNTVDGWAVVEGRVWHTTDEGRMWVHEVLPT